MPADNPPAPEYAPECPRNLPCSNGRYQRQKQGFQRGKRKGRTSLELCGLLMVPEAGIEPARISPGDFESPASTNFTTRAGNKTDVNYGTV